MHEPRFDNPLESAPLHQRGRAALDFLRSLAPELRHVTQAVDHALRARLQDLPPLPDDVEAISNVIEPLLESDPLFAARELCVDWYAAVQGRIAADAFDEAAACIIPSLTALDNGPASLALNPAMSPPRYWEGVWIHRHHGGWDGHPYMGYVHGEIVHKTLVGNAMPGGIFHQRRQVARLAPRRTYERILEMGSSSGHYTVALSEIFPDSEITGIELSHRMLEHARRVANAHGWAWRLVQGDAAHTDFAADQFDLVTSYILLHELPTEMVRGVFAEAFRVLKPGGDLLMSDVTRTFLLDPVQRWWADFGARNGGEPYWRESAALDLAEIARSIGFTDIAARGVGPNHYPYVITARKPHVSPQGEVS